MRRRSPIRTSSRSASATKLDPLQRALGLDRVLRARRRQPTAVYARLLVALLFARDGNFVRTDLLAEAGHLVGAERIGAGDHAAAVLHANRHLGVGHGGAVGVLHEAEIGRPFILAGVVVVAETRSARPH